MFKRITKEFFYKFNVKKEGVYSVSIEASCKSGKMLGLFGGEDLRVEIDDFKLRKVTAKNNTQFFNIPSAWNGTKLKGLPKTVIFILKLKKGEHIIKFIPRRGARIEKEPKIEPIKNNVIIKNLQAKDGNRRPWITIALIDLPLQILDISTICEKRFRDSDDVKLIINGQIQKNKISKIWGKNWYWRGSQLKGSTKSARFYLNLKKANHNIEFWADRKPILKELTINSNEESAETLQQYDYKGVNGNEDYNRCDNEIREAVSYWNNEFKKYKYPPTKFLDPNLVKAMIYQESRVGYYPGAEVDIMQVGHPDDPAIKTLNGELEEWYFNKSGKKIKLDYKGKANANSQKESIYWGVRWLYHRAQKIISDDKIEWREWKQAVKRYGPGKQSYVNSIWSVYKKGTVLKSKIKLWVLLLPFLLLLYSGLFALHCNQGRIFINAVYSKEGSFVYEPKEWEVGVLDGVKIKKGYFGAEAQKYDDIWKLNEAAIEAQVHDLNNDGNNEVLVFAKDKGSDEYIYFFEIGDKELKPIPITYFGWPLAEFSATKIEFGPKDEFGRYTFVRVYEGYSDGMFGTWRYYYKFNDNGQIEFFKEEMEPMSEEKIAEMNLSLK